MKQSRVVWGPSIFLLISALASGQPRREYASAKHGGNYMFNFYFPPAPSSTPWAPSWSPDGKWIAVAMSGSIWKIDPGTGVAHELTYNRNYHSSPDWSPDGKWIVYTADDGGDTIQLEILDVETGETRPLTNDKFIYTDPVFSPDGSRMAYVSTRPNGYFNVYIRPIRDGRWAGDEVAVTRDNRYASDRLYFGEWDLHITPAWLPNGEELLIVSNQGVPLGSGNVWRVPAAANGMEKAHTVLAEQTLYRTRPHVSLDGKRFVYSSTRGAADQFSNLYVQPTAGGEPYKLTFFQHDAFHPRWSPDGEWIAYISNEGGLPQLALLETYGGEQRKVSISDRRWKRFMGVLSVRTVDASTGQTTACRVHLTPSDGKFYAPAGAYARVSGVGDDVFHTAGSFTVEVPQGPLDLLAVKGFEFFPEKTRVQVRAGELEHLTLALKRVTDMSAKGWYSGSTHVHLNYAGNLRNTLENLMMMSAAEDQDVVNEQIANKDNRVLDHQFFVPGGGAHALSTPERLLVVGQEYRPPFYGHVFMFGMKNHLISPFTTGYEGTAIESLYPSNTDMLRKAKAQGATVGYVHAFGGERDPIETGLGGGKGYMVDAALGTTDAVEWSGAGRAGFYPWYATLNNGVKVTATGGEDSISSLHYTKLLGSVRTYVYTGARGLDMTAWFEGLRKGHAFVTTGPLVELKVNGRIPGEEIALPAGGGTVEVEARVRSITPLEKVLLVWNGEVREEIPLGADRKTVDFKKTLPVTRSGWFHLRAEGNPKDRYPLDAEYAQAFTNPVWVIVGAAPVRSRAAAEYSIRWIDELQSMADRWPGWRSAREKEHVFAQFEEARQIYRRLAAEAEPPSQQGHRARSYYIMGTLLELEAAGPDAVLDEALEAAYREVERVDLAMSLYRPDSELSRLNRQGPQSSYALSRDTLAVLEAALAVASASAGAFDPTVGPLVELWSGTRVPNTRDLRIALDKVGYRRVALSREKRTVAFEAEGVRVDLNGIAKGYAVDRALAALRAAGVREAWVSLGESSLGSFGAPREVAIRDPLRPDRIATRFRLARGTLSTSGGYRGRRYSHLIDPRTGWPVERSVSATVIAAEGQAMLADALSTAGIVLGPGEAIRFWRRFGVEGILFYGEGERLTCESTPGFPRHSRSPTM